MYLNYLLCVDIFVVSFGPLYSITYWLNDEI